MDHVKLSILGFICYFVEDHVMAVFVVLFPMDCQYYSKWLKKLSS
jgi:hypothetical protein